MIVNFLNKAMKQIYHLYFFILSTSVWSTASSVHVELLPVDNVYVCSPTSSAVQEIAFVCSLTGWTYTVDWTVTSGNGDSNGFTVLRGSPLNVSESYGYTGIQVSLTAESHQYMSSSLIITAPPYQISNGGIVVSCHDGTARSVGIIGVPSLPLNLTTFNYYAVENNTSWFMITISWLPPSLGSSLHVGIDQYIINISPLPNYSYAVPFVTTNTTAFLTLHHNIVYNITVEAVNCAGRGEKAHISCIYEEPVIHGAPSLPFNLTKYNYHPVVGNTSLYTITISWLPPSLGSCLHVDIDHYIIDISPLPNSSYAVPFVTTNTTVFLTLHHNILYNITVEAINCAGRHGKEHISCIYEEPVIDGIDDNETTNGTEILNEYTGHVNEDQPFYKTFLFVVIFFITLPVASLCLLAITLALLAACCITRKRIKKKSLIAAVNRMPNSQLKCEENDVKSKDNGFNFYINGMNHIIVQNDIYEMAADEAHIYETLN